MTRRRASAVVLAALGVLWAVVNGPVEGPVLWKFSAGHGLTTADLLSVALILAAAWRWFVPRRRRSTIG
jgi:hypothetical protein